MSTSMQPLGVTRAAPRWLFALLLGLFGAVLPGVALTQTAQTQPLRAFVDRSDVSLNEVITLTIRVGSQLGGTRPPLDGLDRDFVQLGVSTQNSYTNINGNVQSWTEYRVSIKPKTTGRLTIPAFRVGGEATQPITVTVGEPRQSEGGYRDIFLDTSISKNEVYVQEQLLFTVRLYYDIGFNQGAQLTSPQVENSVVQQLGSDETFQELVDGIRYNVFERRFVIYPQASGELVIPPVHFNATVGGRGLSNILRNQSGRQVNLTSDTHEVVVKGVPEGYSGQTWLPAKHLELSETWSAEPDELGVGESLTRNVRVRAQGLSSSLLPGIAYESIPGLKFYPDQAVRDDSAGPEGITGTREEGTAIVPSEPGDYVLPRIELSWWNTEEEREELATLPSRTLKVLAPAGSSSSSLTVDLTPPPQPSQPPMMVPAAQTSGLYLGWIVATVLFAAAWLFTLGLWLRARRQSALAGPLYPQAQGPGQSELPDPSASLAQLRQACKTQDLRAIRQALIAWGQGFFANGNIRNLDQLKVYTDNPTLSALFFNLEQALYGTRGSVEDLRCSQLLKDVESIHHSRKRLDGGGKAALPPLYRN